MQRHLHWTSLVVVGGLSAGAGLLVGGAASVRERNELKTRNALLTSDLRQARELAVEIENQNLDYRAQLSRLAATIQRREDEIVRLMTIAAPVEFHPPMILDTDAIMEARIGELECEVAALKEQQLVQAAGVPGPLMLASVTEESISMPRRLRPESADAPATKERCTAMTQKGTQCTRLARSGGKCWQHGR